MREHPIPQDITSYRFHIIGSMTLRQFAELTAGALLGLVIYMTNLLDIIKWPLIFIAVGLGAATAFLPIEERPLDHWIFTFVRMMYRPTKYFWKRTASIPAWFLFEPGKQNNDGSLLNLTPARRKRIKDYLASVQGADPITDYSPEELEQIQQILAQFANSPTTQNQLVANQLKHKPALKVRARSLTKPKEKDTKVTVYDQSQQIAQETKKIGSKVQIPITEATKLEKFSAKEKDNPATTNTQQTTDVPTYIEQSVIDQNTKQKTTVATDTIFNIGLPFPSKPDKPNKLVGMVLTPNNELIPEAIVEIKDQNNKVVRAVKSNALGQFFITTPLKNGTYLIHADHHQYQFPNQQITLENEIMEPIEVRSLN